MLEAIRASANDEAATSQPEEKYDVYVAEPPRLEEGIEKHIVSVFVADESGIINRVAGVFARRGMNIESLAVGLNVDKALFTIVVNGTASAVSNMVKQLSKLVKVRYVEDVTDEPRLDLELALFKMRVAHGSQRSELLELVTIFGGKVVDVGSGAITVALSGDPGKLYAFEASARNFNLVELARTGRITLRKSDAGLDLGGPMSYSPGRSAAVANRAPEAAAYGALASQDGADVYMVDKNQANGVWNVHNVLEPVYDPQAVGFQPYTLLIEVNDYPGVLNEVTGVLARRGYNIQSLAVGNSETRGRSRITTVVPGQYQSISNLIKQLEKMVVVHQVVDLTSVPHVQRELMLIKVRCTPAQRSEIKDIVDIFECKVAHLSPQAITIEVIGKEAKMQAIQRVLEPYGILEVARTGRVALMRESKVDSALLQTSNLGSYV